MSTKIMDPVLAKQHVPEPSHYEYTARDAIIYALGIGANTRDHLRFLYEGHPDFQVFPTFVVAPALLSGSMTDWPGIEFDLGRVLHGEHSIELFGDELPPDGAKLRSEARVVDVLDKGEKGCLIVKQVTTYDEHTGNKLAVQQFGIFQTGSGGFGGNRTSSAEKKAPEMPADGRPPDFVSEERVQPEQAALYRQGSGDLNPLHIDPDFARMAGFERPILHGLCSLGITTRLALHIFGGNQAKNLRSVRTRFSAPVQPGQTLLVEMWRSQQQNDDGKQGCAAVHFQAKVKETGKIALTNGYIEFNNNVAPLLMSKKEEGMTPAALEEGVGRREHAAGGGAQVETIFRTIDAELAAGTQKEAMKGMPAAVLLYEITSGKGAEGQTKEYYTIELKDGQGRVHKGQPPEGKKATVTVSIGDEDFVKLISGQMDGTKAFLSGRLKVRGQVMLLQKLQSLLGRARNNKQRSKI